MKKIKLSLSVFMALIAMVIVSCSGVDHSDPKSVADAALVCYDKGDYEKMKTLVDPANSHLLNEMDKMVELTRKQAEKHGETTRELKERTFKNVAEEFTGKELKKENRYKPLELTPKKIKRLRF